MPHTVLNRILRHNIRNELTVALGHLDAIEDEQAGRAAGSVRRVNELAEKARTVEHALRSSGTVAVSAAAVARDVVADASAAFPDAASRPKPSPRPRPSPASSCSSRRLRNSSRTASSTGTRLRG